MSIIRLSIEKRPEVSFASDSCRSSDQNVVGAPRVGMSEKIS
jgi:hypothetical protein